MGPPVITETLRFSFALAALLMLAGCTTSDWFWHKDAHSPPGDVILANGERAEIYAKCDTRFLSNSTCERAFGVSSTGGKFSLREIARSVSTALQSTPEYEKWPLVVAQRHLLPPTSVRIAPYRFVLVAVDPVVVLLLPAPPNDREVAGAEKNLLLGCQNFYAACLPWLNGLANPLIYEGQLLHGEGAYWLSPELGASKLNPIPSDFQVYPLPGTNAMLIREGKYLIFSRSRK